MLMAIAASASNSASVGVEASARSLMGGGSAVGGSISGSYLSRATGAESGVEQGPDEWFFHMVLLEPCRLQWMRECRKAFSRGDAVTQITALSPQPSFMCSDSRQSGSFTGLVRVLLEELLRQDPRAVDLSDGGLTRLQVFESINVVKLAHALRAHVSENQRG